MSQQAIDERNAAFWDTLCGWNLAQRAGITGRGDPSVEQGVVVVAAGDHAPPLSAFVRFR